MQLDKVIIAPIHCPGSDGEDDDDCVDGVRRRQRPCFGAVNGDGLQRRFLWCHRGACDHDDGRSSVCTPVAVEWQAKSTEASQIDVAPPRGLRIESLKLGHVTQTRVRALSSPSEGGLPVVLDF